MAQGMGFLPTRNFQQSTFEGADKLSGENLRGKFVVKNKGCFNCTVGCSRFCRVTEGPYAGTQGEGPEYESISSLGSKCGNDRLDSILHANMLCNQLGMDTISTGNVAAWAMECLEKNLIDPQLFEKPLSFGDHEALCGLIRKIALREGIGDILAHGSVRAAGMLGGQACLIHSKGLDYPAVDVRGTKGMALSFAVSPRGGDHLKGLSLYEVAPDLYVKDIEEQTGIRVTDRFWLRYENKAELMIWHEDWHCVVDSLGLCKLEGIALKPLLPRHFRDLLSAATGMDVSVSNLQMIGKRIWNLERMFNAREGLNRADDMPPDRLLNEPIATGPSRGETLDRKRFLELLDRYYRLRGWSIETGIPTKQTLNTLSLDECLEKQNVFSP